jgi:DUF971 family protein
MSSAAQPLVKPFTCKENRTVQQGRDPLTLPTRIVKDSTQRQVRITWADGHESVYGWDYLRRQCPCAHCRGEWGAPGYLDSNPILLADQIQLSAMEHVGHYAIRLSWADGHDSGIYEFRRLRAICPDCAAA